jgi:hypothetical protein
MDKKGFRIRSEPELIYEPTRTIVDQEVQREINAEKTDPAPDARYYAYAAMMEDGRHVTDYRQACVSRAPPGTQFAVKQWTIHNTDELVNISRSRQAQTTGHVLGTANTDIPPSILQSCTPDSCKIQSSGYEYGVGIERNDRAPSLFGTFDYAPNPITLSKNKTSIELNNEIKYGRNTPSRWYNLYQ